ncbi:MAG: TatD family hydrolase [Bacteroidales bacterium]|nr:TatD family hydrolase [Bacteroidales bacterium]MCB9000073.1 TatD family hydrolase [Bacteroidales bacterium]MCB9012722.1 TatD family hydrolase [Bacteroidales bacterium]
MKLFPSEDDFIDIHSHHSEKEANVFRILNVFTSDFPDIPIDGPVSIGLHPWQITEKDNGEVSEVFSKLSGLENLMAIGEAGLDRAIKYSFNIQEEVFRKQIEISIQFNKPMIIHCVKAFPELIRIRREYPRATPWIIHGFNSSQRVAADCIQNGMYISLSHRLFRNEEKAEEICKAVPPDKIFAETDDDPEPITRIYEQTARLYKTNVSEIKKEIYNNFCRVFR